MNKVRPVNISFTEDTQHILIELDQVLNDIGMNRSAWFRRSAVKFIRQYKKYNNSEVA